MRPRSQSAGATACFGNSTFLTTECSRFRPARLILTSASNGLSQQSRSSPRVAERLIYVIVGAGDHGYQEKLQGLVDELDLRHSVRLLGHQTDEVLRDFLAAADFAINLRFPNSEGCSLSLIEQMAFRNPVIAIDSGMYREMPDTAVIKLPVDDENHGLIAALEQLTFNETLRAEMGQSAEAFARANFSLQRYVARLLECISKASFSLRPVDMSLIEVSAALTAGSIKSDCDINIEPVLQQFHSLVNGRTRQALHATELKTLGIWLVAPEAPRDHREFELYRRLAQQLIERHQIDCEVWCRSRHESYIVAAFKPLLSDSRYEGKIRVIHEMNRASADSGRSSAFEEFQADASDGRLSALASSVSRADCFLIGARYLESARTLTRPLFISIGEQDLMATYGSPAFECARAPTEPRALREAIQYVARYGASFICGSELTRSQLMKYVRSLDADKVSVIELPADASLPSEHAAPLDGHKLSGGPASAQAWSDVARAYFLQMSAQVGRVDISDGSHSGRPAPRPRQSNPPSA